MVKRNGATLLATGPAEMGGSSPPPSTNAPVAQRERSVSNDREDDCSTQSGGATLLYDKYVLEMKSPREAITLPWAYPRQRSRQTRGCDVLTQNTLKKYSSQRH